MRVLPPLPGSIGSTGDRCVRIAEVWVQLPLDPPFFWAGMYRGGDTALQAACGEFDSRPVHQIQSWVR